MRKVTLVHGFWHGSWCWSLVTDQLAGRGVQSVAVDMDGHGLKSRSPRSRWGRPFDPAAFAVEPSPVAGVTASSAAETIVGQLKVIGGGEPGVVVAHSMGGVVATAAAELAPELFAHLVYVAAFAPVRGLPAGAYIASPENEGSLIPDLLRADPVAGERAGVPADGGDGVDQPVTVPPGHGGDLVAGEVAGHGGGAEQVVVVALLVGEDDGPHGPG